MFKEFLVLIYPFTPHIASECWEKNYGNKEINGKKRALLDAEPDQSEEKIFNECLEIENIKNLVSGKNIIKKIYVKNKLVNIVIK